MCGRWLSELLLLQPSTLCEHGFPLVAPDALSVIMTQYTYFFFFIHSRKNLPHLDKYTVSVNVSELLRN
jgi:hypothetical protein